MKKKTKVVGVVVAAGIVLLGIFVVLFGSVHPKLPYYQPYSGKHLFVTEACITCHTINNGHMNFNLTYISQMHTVSQQGGSLGPNLTYIGQQWNLAWLKEQIIDPEAHFTDNTMPSYRTMSAQKLDKLSGYLESLK
ncbi:MAG: c-type cytochrome [Candidatus Acididesulfobacter guangdongensis]|uniref:C-type cytochrome n=1 Tax=Acididesulfobacter guangdongensis TaxID=2597225 RepID=A0A519BEQ8_ACIG2|nr:MAG: c-type cytochrome [Candidatus Acididesulfobacter guangdongensis]